MRGGLWSISIALLPLMLPYKAIAASFSQLYIFGDSLSDAGNLSRSTFSLIPQSPPYDRRFSNGEVWVEYLADSLDLDPQLITEPFVPFIPALAPDEGINFAFGGATTGTANATIDVGPLSRTGVLSQVSRLETTVNLGFRPDNEEALYILLAGANDYANGLATTVDQPIQNTATAIERLFDLGARNFLISNLPDIGQTPLFRETEQADDLSLLIAAHNTALTATLTQLENQLPDINLLEFDLNGLFNEVLANPASYGFTNTTDPCLTNFSFPFDFRYGVCEEPDQFLFWDDFHPTTVAHQIIADTALISLETFPFAPATRASGSDTLRASATLMSANVNQTVPEPTSNWSLIALGALGTGVVIRQRTNRSHSSSANKVG